MMALTVKTVWMFMVLPFLFVSSFHHHESLLRRLANNPNYCDKFGKCRFLLHQSAAQRENQDNQQGNADEDDESDRLRRAADQLRREIAEFQQQKEFVRQQQEMAQQALLQQQEQDRLRYSAELPIAKPDGSEVMERIYFRPFWPNMESTTNTTTLCSTIITCEVASLPLGLLLGEHEQFAGAVGVDDILQEDGFGALAGVQIGDLLRACTACRTIMDRPTWQLLAGGIGRPKTIRYMYDVDGRKLEDVLEAIRSNRLDPLQRPILLVLERLEQRS